MMNNILTKRLMSLLFGLTLCLGLCGCDQKEELEVFNAKNANQLPQAMQTPQQEKKLELPTDEEPTVVLNVGGFGRTNPFVPYTEKSLAYSTGNISNMPTLGKLSISNPDLPPPPGLSEQNPSLSALMQAKVGGILYDGKNPTAIVNIKDTDYLVHRGDHVFNFYIKDIFKDKVAIKSGNNIYRAGIGEIVYGNVIDNNVSNLQSKFGGSSAPSNYTSLKSLPSLPDISTQDVQIKKMNVESL